MQKYQETITIPVIFNYTFYKQYRSHWAPETNWLPPHVSPLGPPPSWRELATTCGCPDNQHPPTAVITTIRKPATLLHTHKYNHIKGPIVTHPKWPIDLEWPEMRSKVIFGHPKWPPKKKSVSIWMARIAIESELQTFQMADRSEMARNAVESDFRTSKMSAILSKIII